MNHDIAHASALPFSTDSLDGLAARIATGATIVGIGGSTRFSREISGLQDQLFRRLVTQHGFRLLALQEHAGAVDRLDRYVRTGEGSAESALDAAWRPWRTAETAAALRWIRAFNRDHPDDQVQIVGTKPAQAQHEDYDAVLGHVRALAPDRLPELTAHLEPIRTAHDLDEHVQRAQGVHPGRPFAEHARDALALLKSLPTAKGSEAMLARMRLILDFHEQSVAGQGSFGGEDDAAADMLAGHQRRTGLRMVFWDGIAHTSAAPFRLGTVSDGALMPSVGSELRARYGAGYVAVAIGFHHGTWGSSPSRSRLRTSWTPSSAGRTRPRTGWICAGSTTRTGSTGKTYTATGQARRRCGSSAGCTTRHRTRTPIYASPPSPPRSTCSPTSTRPVPRTGWRACSTEVMRPDPPDTP
ncbi:hypothetical protein Srufu_000050 [Streptomyces libani subsp. rufus]|nr:hypothetical protein Srufu_000050 [Streptomyces libani subsp. rufus]